MRTRLFCILLGAAGLALAQEQAEELVAYSPEEIDNLMNTFLQTYKNKKAPEDDAIATLANLKGAYRYIEAKGEGKTKDDEKLQKEIIKLIAKKGLFARNRDRVNLECARVLGELGDEDANKDLRRWLEGILDAKSPMPQCVEYGFQSLAWIGSDDRQSLDLALDYATKGKHPDIGVAAQAMKACYQWRKLDANTREDFFKKISGYLQGLYSKAHGGDPKQRGTYEGRYNAVKEEGLKALEELAGDGSKFADPNAAVEWLKENKRRKWEPYVGPRYRVAEKPGAKKEDEKKEADS